MFMPRLVVVFDHKNHITSMAAQIEVKRRPGGGHTCLPHKAHKVATGLKPTSESR